MCLAKCGFDISCSTLLVLSKLPNFPSSSCLDFRSLSYTALLPLSWKCKKSLENRTGSRPTPVCTRILCDFRGTRRPNARIFAVVLRARCANPDSILLPGKSQVGADDTVQGIFQTTIDNRHSTRCRKKVDLPQRHLPIFVFPVCDVIFLCVQCGTSDRYPRTPPDCMLQCFLHVLSA